MSTNNTSNSQRQTTKNTNQPKRGSRDNERPVAIQNNFEAQNGSRVTVTQKVINNNNIGSYDDSSEGVPNEVSS